VFLLTTRRRGIAVKSQRKAGPKALSRIPLLINGLRACLALSEKREGVFFLNSREVVHFHEVPSGIVADLCLGRAQRRILVDSESEQYETLGEILDLVDRAQDRRSADGASNRRSPRGR
jgi:hypothetical protein